MPCNYFRNACLPKGRQFFLFLFFFPGGDIDGKEVGREEAGGQERENQKGEKNGERKRKKKRKQAKKHVRTRKQTDLARANQSDKKRRRRT